MDEYDVAVVGVTFDTHGHNSDGIDPDVVHRAVSLIDRAEYKRRQAPPGVRLRPKAFGRDRRTPITNHWRG